MRNKAKANANKKTQKPSKWSVRIKSKKKRKDQCLVCVDEVAAAASTTFYHIFYSSLFLPFFSSFDFCVGVVVVFVFLKFILTRNESASR